MTDNVRTGLLVCVAGHPDGKRVLCPRNGSFFNGINWLPLKPPSKEKPNTPALVRHLANGNLSEAISEFVSVRSADSYERTIETDQGGMMRLCSVTISWHDIEGLKNPEDVSLKALDAVQNEPTVRRFLECSAA